MLHSIMIYTFLSLCPLRSYSYSAGFIHQQTSAWHHHCYSVRISFRPGPWPPGPPSAPVGSLGSYCRAVSAAVTADHHCCHLLPQRRPQALKQPSSAIRRKHDLRQATLGRRKLVVSLLELVLCVFVDCLRYITHFLHDVQYYP